MDDKTGGQVMIEIARPSADEHAAFYQTYVDEASEGPVLEALAEQGRRVQGLLAGLDEERALHRYAEGKWSVKEVIGHLIDAERIFTYRALAAARGDSTPLPGFAEDEYVATAEFDARAVADLAAEHAAVRASTLALFGGLSDREIARRGVSNGAENSVRALAWIIAGHERHHLRVLAERYGLG